MRYKRYAIDRRGNATQSYMVLHSRTRVRRIRGFDSDISLMWQSSFCMLNGSGVGINSAVLKEFMGQRRL